MNPVEPVWVGVLMTIMTGIGLIIPKISSWFSDRKKDKQGDIEFIVANLKGIIEIQAGKLSTLEMKLLDLQQKLLDMQSANVNTLTENLKMKEQIKVLTAENSELRLKIDDMERRMPK